MFVDSHVHLDCLPTGRTPKEESELARRAGVDRFVIPGVRREGWAGLLRLAKEVPGGMPAPGIHPQAADEWHEDAAAELSELLRDGRAVAVGEIGLDQLLPYPPPEVQERAFRGQLRVAAAAGLPVLLHCRRAAARVLAILDEEGWRLGGIWHAFSGSAETAREAVARGFAIGFAGPVTYPGARRAPEVLRSLPATAIVLETDAPDLAPHPHRGESNRPAYLPLIAARVAELRGWSVEEAARITTGNVQRILKIG
jgi:TatD DNase family protein